MRVKITAALTFILALLSLSGSSSAQTIGSANFTYQGAFSLNSGDVLSLSMQIVGCGQGNLPKYNNLPISVTPNQTNLQGFVANGSQLVTAILPGNDKITCSTQSYTTYAATWLDNGFPLAPTQTFRLIDNQSVSLNATPAIGFVPPVLQNAAGVYCPLASAPVFLGFNANYTPNCATIAAAGGTPSVPAAGGSIFGNLLFQYPYGPSAAFINGTPQADQFPGADMCVKVRAAEVYALANSIHRVDATHFTGTQVCSVDMFGGITTVPNAVANLTVLFGDVVIQTTVPQSVTSSGLRIQGSNYMSTVLQYVGTAAVPQAVLYVNGSTGSTYPGINGFQLTNFFIVGNSHVVDGLQMVSTHRSLVENVSVWGVNGDGIHVLGAVTDTFHRVHVSSTDAFWMGFQGATPTPAIGIELGSFGGNRVTDGTFTDFITEGLTTASGSATGIGLKLTSANSMVFTAGTSETNQQGILILGSNANEWNTFISPDIEGNLNNTAGVDVQDNGTTTTWINPIFASTCTSCASYNASVGSFILGESGAHTGTTGAVNIFGANTNVSNLNGTFVAGSSALGTTNVASMQVNQHIINQQGLQISAQAGCTISAGAIGNFCNNTIALPITMPSSSYHVSCGALLGTGLWTLGAVNSFTTTSFIIASIAFSTSATGGGFVDCVISQ